MQIEKEMLVEREGGRILVIKIWIIRSTLGILFVFVRNLLEYRIVPLITSLKIVLRLKLKCINYHKIFIMNVLEGLLILFV